MYHREYYRDIVCYDRDSKASLMTVEEGVSTKMSNKVHSRNCKIYQQLQKLFEYLTVI